MKIMHEAPEEKNKFWSELIKLLLIAVLVIIPFRMFVAQPFIVDGASMDPTFRDKQYLIVDELTYHFTPPERGSVIIFKYPNDPSKYFIKRIIGLPGETVKIDNGQVTVINPARPEGFVLTEPYVVFKKADSSTLKLSNDEYFVMGDNRLGSADSRMWGPVPKTDLIGRPILRVWPISIWPGDETDLLSSQNVQN
ncbi:MAG: signal peptidase I [Minisyncoccota bacterium]